MNILFINYIDLVGRSFNGYNLMLELNAQGHNTKMVVKQKSSDNLNVIEVCDFNQQTSILTLADHNNTLCYQSNKYSNGCVNDILELYEYNNADVVHIHITYLQFLSFYDYQKLFKDKKIVITLHDAWFLTGGCTNNFSCSNYKAECDKCEINPNEHDVINFKYAKQAFYEKLKLFNENNISIICASEMMLDYFKLSPMAKYTTHYEKIPFGVDTNIMVNEKLETKKHFGIVESDFVIGFRNEERIYKGRKYVFEALKNLNSKNITIICVSETFIPKEISDKFNCICLGLIKDSDLLNKFYSACDIFLMPSISETFGLMAIEAMANETPVLCFKDTVLEEIIGANEYCGIAVDKYNSKQISEKIKYYINNRQELEKKGVMSKELVKKQYSIETYTNKHIQFYEKVING